MNGDLSELKLEMALVIEGGKQTLVGWMRLCRSEMNTPLPLTKGGWEGFGRAVVEINLKNNFT